MFTVHRNQALGLIACSPLQQQGCHSEESVDGSCYVSDVGSKEQPPVCYPFGFMRSLRGHRVNFGQYESRDASHKSRQSGLVCCLPDNWFMNGRQTPGRHPRPPQKLLPETFQTVSPSLVLRRNEKLHREAH